MASLHVCWDESPLVRLVRNSMCFLLQTDNARLASFHNSLWIHKHAASCQARGMNLATMAASGGCAHVQRALQGEVTPVSSKSLLQGWTKCG